MYQPVSAKATISLPANQIGMASTYIGVENLNPRDVQASQRVSVTPRSVNVFGRSGSIALCEAVSEIESVHPSHGLDTHHG